VTTYNEYFSSVKWDVISQKISSTTRNQVAQAINREGRGGIEDFTALLSPIAASEFLEPMARLSHSLTQKRFGKLFVCLPLFIFRTSATMFVITVGLVSVIRSYAKP
jgi:2-iminoacetate synthase